MNFLDYYISFKNYETEDVEIQLQDLSTLEDPPGPTIRIDLQGAENPAIMSSTSSDDDKTTSIKGKRLDVSFNSKDNYDFNGTPGLVNADTFSDGEDGRFLVRFLIGSSVPFLGNLVLDDNSEAFQPRPNPVTLSAGDGLGILKNIELKTTGGATPIGHYSLMDYIVMCLSFLVAGQQIHVVMNLYEESTNPNSSHAFKDTFLDALTFEKDIDTREDKFTVLQKIFDAFGCFICFDTGGWYIIRWDEYDTVTAVTTLRTAHFTSAGVLINYTNDNYDKIIAAIQTGDYQGYRLSQDSAQKRFQRKAHSVTHTYKFEQPKEVPCNSAFLRGTKRAESPEDLTFDNYDFACWALHKGPPNVTNDGDAYIKIKYDALYESERYLLFAVQPTNLQYYVESEPIRIDAGDKFSISVDLRHNGQVETAAGTGNYNAMQVRLYADDNTYYTLDPIDNVTTLASWVASDSTWSTNNRYFKRFFDGTEDDTEWHSIGNDYTEVPAIPKGGYLTICLHQTKKSNQFETHFYNLKFEYVPLINGSYHRLNGQEQKVTGNDDSRKIIEKEMFISDSPKRLFKGAMKKLSGGNYILTGKWNHFDNSALLNERMSKFTVFAWWNQFRKTRTVIESDFQGINSTNFVPGLIHRYKVKHELQGNKYFMLTSFTGMNFMNCGWRGVLVEISSGDGDRIYTDTFSFKYIQ